MSRRDPAEEILLPCRPPAGIIRGVWGRQYASGRISWHAMVMDIRQAHKRQIFRAACMTLQDASQDAAIALNNAAALRRLLQGQGQA
jgi:hypothetical protein